MLYEGAIKFLNQAIVAMEVEEYSKKGRLLSNAQEIILELNLVLNVDEGGEISKNLRSLYNYMWSRLAVANNKCDPLLVREVIELLEYLKEGFNTISV